MPARRTVHAMANSLGRHWSSSSGCSQQAENTVPEGGILPGMAFLPFAETAREAANSDVCQKDQPVNDLLPWQNLELATFPVAAA